MLRIRLKPPQGAVFLSDARFRILVAGRRFGKTYLSLVELCRAAWGPGRLVWYVAPSYKQAKRIAWKPLKEMTRPYWASKPNETDLRIELTSGGTICLRGADNYDSLRGDGLDFVILDEFASIDREAWTKVLRPALADRRGRALFIGTPQGYNHFYELYEKAKDKPDWATFQFTTEQGGNVTREELETAAHELDRRTFEQEFQARFENLTAGRVYYDFDRVKNLQKPTYDPGLPLCWALDFNIEPMCSVIAQIDGDYVRVLEEIVLPNTRTPGACAAFLARAEKWIDLAHRPVPVRVYGDSNGNRRESCAEFTDWQIVRNFFERESRVFEVTYHRRADNPPVKDRVAAVNAMLLNHLGQRRLKIDLDCKGLIADFDRVHWETDPHENIVFQIAKTDPNRTHLSDALGYMIEKEFGMRTKGGERSGYVA